MRSLRFPLLAVVATLSAAGMASAQINYTYQLADASTGNALSGNQSVSSGNTFSVRVYLVETDGAGTLRNTGLSGTGAQLNFSPAGIVSVPAASQTTDIQAGPGFTPSLQTGGTANAVLKEFSSTIITNVTSPVGDPTRILVGTFTLTKGATPGTATLQAVIPSGNTTSTGSGPAIDSQIGPSQSIGVTFSAVPEPGSMALCGLGAIGLAAFRRRRKAAAANAVAA